MSVRPAKPSEVGMVLALWREMGKDPTAMDEPMPMSEANLRTMSEFITKLIEEDPRQVLVVEKNGELAGFLMFQRTTKSPIEMDRKWASITDLYVRPFYRRQGIGEKLLRTCIDDLRLSGATHARIRVWSKNENAIRLYRKVGFGDYTLTLEARLADKAQ